MLQHLDQIDWGSVDAAADPAAFSAYLDRLDALPLIQQYRRHVLDRIPCQPGDRVLDAGCGAGGDTRQLGERVGPRGAVLGVDLSRHLLRHARERVLGPIGCVAGDLLSLPVPDGCLDGVFCHRVLMHLEHPATAVTEFVRVLRSGGWLALAEPDWSSARLEPDTGTGRTVLRAHAAAFAQGGIGSQLEALVRQTGCTVSGSAIDFESIRDFDSIWPSLNLERTLQRLTSDGELSTAQVEEWRAQVAAGAGSGTFCFGVALGLCVGHKC